MDYALLFAEEVRMTKDGGVYHLPVKINDVIELKFVVDTGASDVFIPADVAMTLIRAEAITDSDFRGKGAYQMADGSLSHNEKINLRSLKIGSQTIYNVEASIASAKGMLLLGQSALSKIEPWRIDTNLGLFIFGDLEENGKPKTNLSTEDKMTCSDFERQNGYNTDSLERFNRIVQIDFNNDILAYIVSLLCKNDIKKLERGIDNGSYTYSAAERVKVALGLDHISISEKRSIAGLKFEQAVINLRDIDLCRACIGVAAEYYVRKPDTKCAKLVGKVLAGDKKAENKLKGNFWDLCPN